MKNIFLSFIICFITIVMFSACNKEELCEPNNNTPDCFCIEIYAPVCGCDGKTYSNDCYAECAEVSFISGPCE